MEILLLLPAFLSAAAIIILFGVPLILDGIRNLNIGYNPKGFNIFQIILGIGMIAGSVGTFVGLVIEVIN